VLLLILGGTLLLVLALSVWFLFHFAIESKTARTGVVAPSSSWISSAYSPIGGIVVDEQGSPIPGVHISFSWDQPVPEERGHAIANATWKSGNPVITDNRGRWTYSGVPAKSAEGMTLFLNRDAWISKNVSAPPIDQLQAQTLKMVMSKGRPLSGRVVDRTGRAVAGATVTGEYPDKVTTDKDGRFELRNCPEEFGSIVVTAAGFAPLGVQISASANRPPIVVTMLPAKTLRVRLVDSAGKQVGGAQARVDSWAQGYLPGTWRSDNQGRFKIDDAPPDAIHFRIDKGGFPISLLTASASNDETVVTMLRKFNVTGTVVDAQTGKSVPSFTAVEGHSDIDYVAPYFSYFRAHTFKQGSFDLTLPWVNDLSYSTQCWVLVEADGYLPAIAKVTASEQLPPIRLKPHSDLEGQLTTQDGANASGVPILIVPADVSPLVMHGGRLVHGDNATFPTTGSDGSFRIRPQFERFQVWAIHDSGFAVAQFPAVYDGPIAMKLLPWPSLRIRTGVTTSGESDSVDAYVLAPTDPSESRSLFVDWRDVVEVNPSGDCSISRLPTFDGGLAVILLERDGRAAQKYDAGRSVVVNVNPGANAKVDLRGGVNVTGHIAPPSDFENIGAPMHITLRALPAHPAAQWPVRAIDAAKISPPVFSYGGNVDAYGRFAIPNVAAGKYEYAIFDHGLMMNGGTNTSTIGCGIVDVPNGPAGSQFAVGELKYDAVRPLVIGETAPAVLGRTLEGKSIRTADFTGKYIVWALWNSYESINAKAQLDSLAHALAGDGRIAFVGVNCDCAAIRNADNNFLQLSPWPRPKTLGAKEWSNGYCSLIDEPMVLSARPANEFEACVLLISPDGKVADICKTVQDAAKVLPRRLQRK
jgi:hypothetical protein